MSVDVNHDGERSGFALVIGGGGAVAAASCCGALRGLSEVAGIDPSTARVIIGTSAGAALAAELRLGRTVDEMAGAMASDEGQALGTSTHAAWTSKQELVRRVIGSSYIMVRSVFPSVWRIAPPPRLIQRAFPGALVSIASEHWVARYPSAWPKGELWLVASDLDTGRRVVLTCDRYEDADVPFTKAVQASCAVPGFYAPVRIGSRRLVDGGVQSATNLDLAAATGCRAVIALAPTSFDRRQSPGYLRSLPRVPGNSKLDREVGRVRRAGMSVLTVRPGAEELQHHKFNILSREGHQSIMKASYETTARRISEGAGSRVLDMIRAETPAAPAASA
jgi:NTE family protein